MFLHKHLFIVFVYCWHRGVFWLKFPKETFLFYIKSLLVNLCHLFKMHICHQSISDQPAVIFPCLYHFHHFPHFIVFQHTVSMATQWQNPEQCRDNVSGSVVTVPQSSGSGIPRNVIQRPCFALITAAQQIHTWDPRWGRNFEPNRAPQLRTCEMEQIHSLQGQDNPTTEIHQQYYLLTKNIDGLAAGEMMKHTTNLRENTLILAFP